MYVSSPPVSRTRVRAPRNKRLPGYQELPSGHDMPRFSMTWSLFPSQETDLPGPTASQARSSRTSRPLSYSDPRPARGEIRAKIQERGGPPLAIIGGLIPHLRVKCHILLNPRSSPGAGLLPRSRDPRSRCKDFARYRIYPCRPLLIRGGNRLRPDTPRSSSNSTSSTSTFPQNVGNNHTRAGRSTQPYSHNTSRRSRMLIPWSRSSMARTPTQGHPGRWGTLMLLASKW